MQRILKIVLGLFGALLLLLLIGVAAATLFIDPNDYRDSIATRVEEQTGRKLVIEGEIKLSFFPWLGLKLGAMELGNAAGFADSPFARIEAAEARVKLLPLLKLQTEIDTVVLRGLVLNLQRRADGVSNWEDLAGSGTAGVVEEEQPASVADAQKLEQVLAALAIGGIVLEEASVAWQDDLNRQRFSLDHFNFSAGAIRIGVPVPLKLTTGLLSSNPEMEGALEFSGTVTADPLARRYSVAGMQLATRLDGKGVPGGRLAVVLGGDAAVDLATQQATLQGLTLNGMGVELATEMAATQILGKPELQGSLTVKLDEVKPLLGLLPASALPAGLDLTALAGTRLQSDFALSLQGERASVKGLQLALPGGTVTLDAEAQQILGSPAASGKLALNVSDGVRFSAVAAKLLPPSLQRQALSQSRLATSFSVDLGEAQSLSLAPLTLATLGVDLNASVSGEKIIDAPRFSGELKLGEFVPRQLLTTLGVALPEMADPSTLGKATLTSHFDAGLNHVALDKLLLRLDKSELQGSASLRNFAAPVIRYTLLLDAIDVDRYLPPPSEAPIVPAATPATVAAAAATELPLELLRALDIDGTLRIGRVKAMNLHSDTIVTTLKAEKGRFRLHPLSARLYQGNYSGDVGFDASGKEAQLSMDERLSGVEAGPLLLDFMGKDYVTGTAELQAKMSASGIEPLAIRKSLNGSGSFSFAKGAVKGFNLGQLIRNAEALYNKQPQPKEEVKETDFSELRGSFNVKNGLLSTSDLAARSTLFQVAGKGTVNLVSEQLDLRLDTTIVSDIRDATGQRSGELKGQKIPVTIGGSFSDPKFGVDLASVLQARAQAEIDKKKAELQQELDRKKKAAEEEAKKRVEEEKQKLQKDLENKFKNMLKF
jgi:AsmA protein